MAGRRPAWRRAARWVKGRLSRARIYLRWLVHEVPRDPAYQFYARRQAWKDRRANQAEKAARPEAVRKRLAPFRPSTMPRIVWMYWHQSAEAAPFVVRRCIESWERHNPGWEIRVLDAETVDQYADMSDVPDHLPFRYTADLLRARLLKRYGGVWADATCYCHRPLDDWIWLQMTAGFFALADPGPGRAIATWFLVGEASHVLLDAWETRYGQLVRGLRYMSDLYFNFTYVFQWCVRRDRTARVAFARMPRLPAGPSFVMIEALNDPFWTEQLQGLVAAGLPVSKLTWRTELSPAAFDAFCARIEPTPPSSG